MIEQPRGFHRHEARELYLDLGLSQRMGHALVCPNRLAPSRPLIRVPTGLFDRAERRSIGQRRTQDAFGIEADEDLREPLPFIAEQAVGAHAYVVEEERELPIGPRNLHSDERLLESVRVGIDDEQGQTTPSAFGSVIAKAIFISPDAIFGSHCCFWASLPNRAMTVAQIAGDTSNRRRGQPAAAHSLHTIASS